MQIDTLIKYTALSVLMTTGYCLTYGQQSRRLVSQDEVTKVYISDIRARYTYKVESAGIPTGKGRVFIISQDSEGKNVRQSAVFYQKGFMVDKVESSFENSYDLAPGSYDLKILRGINAPADLERERNKVVVLEGKVTTVNLGQTGRLQCLCKDFDGKNIRPDVFVSLYYNQENPDYHSKSHTSKDFELPPGKYTIKVSYSKSVSLYKDVEIKSGKLTTVEIAGFGRLKWTYTDPSGKRSYPEVFIYKGKEVMDGNNSDTSNDAYDLPPGNYTLEFSNDHMYGKAEKTIAVTAGKTVTQNINELIGRLDLYITDAKRKKNKSFSVYQSKGKIHKNF